MTASDEIERIDQHPRRNGTLLAGDPLALSDRAEIEALLEPLREGLSEYSFPNLFLFRERHSYRFQRGDLPCIAGYTYDGERHLLPLFDIGRLSASQLAERLAGHDCYFPLSDARARSLDTKRFSIAASPDDADYIYSVANFVDYENNTFDSKRAEIQQLMRHGRPVALPFGRSSIPAAIGILEASLADGTGRSAMSYGPCRDAIVHAIELGLEGHLYFLDEEPIGFLLGEMVAEQVMALHFAKGRSDLPGVQAMMFHHAATVVGSGVRWFNFEQDLGHADFREDKQAYQPTVQLQKYRARPTSLSGLVRSEA